MSTWVQASPNFSVDAYLERHLGPKHLPEAVVVPLTVVYILILISGLVGNFCVCLVIVKKTSMQTSTNYYLFSLAVSDLLLLVLGLPNDLFLFWRQYPSYLGEGMCRTRALISEMTNYASVLTIVAFTAERYVAICHPLLSQTTSSLSRVAVIIAVNWLVAAISAVPFALYTSVHYIDYPLGSKNYIRESAFCMMPTDVKDNPHFRPLLCLSSLAFFFVPMTLIVILYIKIGITLHRSTLRPTECTSLKSDCSKPSSRRVIIKMLGNYHKSNDANHRWTTFFIATIRTVYFCRFQYRPSASGLVAVVIAFIICWAPFHAQRLLFVYAEARHWPVALRKINEILYFAGCLYYLNATINPILYNVMSVKYREAFREILCEKWSRLSRCCLLMTSSPALSAPPHSTNYSMSMVTSTSRHHIDRWVHRRSSTVVETCTVRVDVSNCIGQESIANNYVSLVGLVDESPVNSELPKNVNRHSWYRLSKNKNNNKATATITNKNDNISIEDSLLKQTLNAEDVDRETTV